MSREGSSKMKVHALLLAGGTGTRFGTDKPKQFVEVDGIPIIVYTLKKLQVDIIDDISIVCIEKWISYLKDLIEKYNIKKVMNIIPGGQSGHQSTYNGLNSIGITAEKGDIVLIHDSVRPLVPEKVILDAIDKAKRYGTGCASLKSIEGLVIRDNDACGSTLADRYNIMRIQTPQAYSFDLIKTLYDKAALEGKEYPYADGICICNGIPIYFSKSFTANTKITTKPDIAFMKAMMQFTDNELMGDGI